MYLPICHYQIVTCTYQIVITELSLPNCHLTKLEITKLSLPNCPYQIDVNKNPPVVCRLKCMCNKLLINYLWLKKIFHSQKATFLLVGSNDFMTRELKTENKYNVVQMKSKLACTELY